MVNQPGKLASAVASQLSISKGGEDDSYEELLDQYSGRRFAEGEFPAQLGTVEGGTTTTLTVPKDRAKKQWFVHVEAAQLVRVCR